MTTTQDNAEILPSNINEEAQASRKTTSADQASTTAGSAAHVSDEAGALEAGALTNGASQEVEARAEDSPSTTTAPVKKGRPPVYKLDMETLERICTVVQVRGSGPGGQHRNKAYTGVRLFHSPSGLVVTATERRSFQQNRANAFERLIERLQSIMHQDKPRKETRIPRSVKRKRLENKKKRAVVKKARGRINDW